MAAMPYGTQSAVEFRRALFHEACKKETAQGEKK